MINHKLDTDLNVFFYEQEFYVLSNFSAFEVIFNDRVYKTAEHAYQTSKFSTTNTIVMGLIRNASSAHEAFSLARTYDHCKRKDWDNVKLKIMGQILREKAQQHEYVRRKLLETKHRVLIEDSWRDDFWGWGPNKDGKNMLGKLWMEIRDEIRMQKTLAND